MKGNTVSIRGNVTRDAETRRTQSGNNAVHWGIAWNSSKKDEGGQWVDVPHYFDVECWMTDAQLNSVAPQIVKGVGCAIIDGHLEYQSWNDNDGNKRSKVVVRVDDPIQGLLFRGSGYAGKQPPQAAYGAQQQGYSYGQQPATRPQGYSQQPRQQAYGYGQQPMQAAPQPQMPQPAQQPMPSLYDEDIPF